MKYFLMFCILWSTQAAWANKKCITVRNAILQADQRIHALRMRGSGLSKQDPEHIYMLGVVREQLVKLVQYKIELNETKNEVCRGTPTEALISYRDTTGATQVLPAQVILLEFESGQMSGFFDLSRKP